MLGSAHLQSLRSRCASSRAGVANGAEQARNRSGHEAVVSLPATRCSQRTTTGAVDADRETSAFAGRLGRPLQPRSSGASAGNEDYRFEGRIQQSGDLA
jgi:hypothetical protein